MRLLLVVALFGLTLAAGKKDFRDDIRKLKGLNQNILYDALKHNRIQDHVDLDDEDKELLSRMSKVSSINMNEIHETSPYNREESLELDNLEQFSTDEKQEIIHTAAPAKLENNGRARWNSTREYLLCCIGLAVGLGNVWRFPWVAMKNGGGAFMVPYLVMLVLEGIPLLYLEISLGQMFQVGPAPLWGKLSRWSKGIGFSSMLLGILSGTFYGIVFAWILYYFAISFKSPLPWSQCPNDAANNFTGRAKCKQLGSTEYYWYYETLHISDTISDVNHFSWQIFLCLIFSYALVMLCIYKGIRTTGKVVYFTALFPYVVIAIFFVQGFMLDGYEEGLKLLFTPQWEKLRHFSVWKDAASQVFFSIGIGYGGMIAFSSYNDYKENILKNTLLISLINSATSIFAAIGMFSILGHRATKKSIHCYQGLHAIRNNTNTSSSYSASGNFTFIPAKDCSVKHFMENTEGGTGLAFIAFTEAIDLLPASNFFAVMFFLMLVTLALDSIFGGVESTIISIEDYKWLTWASRLQKLLILSTLSLLGTVAYCTSIGSYLVQLFNDFGVDIVILFVSFAEVTVVAYVYGMKRYFKELKSITGQEVPLYFQICWRFLSPLLLLVIIVVTLYQWLKKSPQYVSWNTELGKSMKLSYPGWAIACGSLVLSVCVLFIPLGLVYECFRQRKRAHHRSNSNINFVDT